MKLSNTNNIYFVGIGGIGMSAIAKYFVTIGKKVAGYDKTSSQITDELEALGVDIHFEDKVQKIPISFLEKHHTLVVFTPAIPKNHSELNHFKEHNFTILKRAQVLGMISENTFCLAVAGTHGKTTTTAILGHLMKSVDATSFLGGISENYQSNLLMGGDKISVVEADEFDRSFLYLHPNIACITSIDADHLDIYKEATILEDSFLTFSKQVSDTLIFAKGLPLNGLTFAINDTADYQAYNLTIKEGSYCFDVKTPTSKIENIVFHLPGKHNIMNALAAIAMADTFGISKDILKERLATFQGVKRRFTYKIKTSDFVLIDDYAHHPTEIIAIEKALREMYPTEKVLVVFQPHLFSRTRDFIDDFANSLSKFDEIILLDIYPARELPIAGVDANWLLEKIKNKNKKISKRNALFNDIRKSKCKIVAMLGAGDIGEMAEEVTNKFKQPSNYEI